VAVSAGALPHPGDTGTTKNVAASTQVGPVTNDTTAHLAADTPSTAPATTEAPTTVPPTTVAPAPAATTPTTKAPVATTKPTTKTTIPTTVAPAAAVVTTTPAAPVVTTVARRVPSAAEVQAAITALPQYVHSILTPTAAQVAQLGDAVCTAFDQGQTFAQVKATGLSLVTKVPLTTILPGGADWVVRTAVNLYCPGYASKLV
jgi:hypothetical protein